MDELEAAGVKLAMVSIGLPEKGQQLVEHLEFDKGADYLFVDPDNVLYDELDLNRGVQRTFFNINTPFAFLKRIQKKDGLKDLVDILGRWSRAIFIPPKQEQAFLQGGTFVFNGPCTVYAHYDPSTAAHAEVEQVMKIALEQVKAKQTN